ncbi:MAG: hypothetical protein HLX47_13210 [Staphylococcus sp.]|uniref:hypothetical protein n=1 Tax=Staphylococcus sp. TaxID=29387 RepID=UPI00179DB9A9|nr:hypothetical protein [Staphylococcus sp.]NWN86820.1 hypothetical protein [Staphylococcus sp.]
MKKFVSFIIFLFAISLFYFNFEKKGNKVLLTDQEEISPEENDLKINHNIIEMLNYEDE